MKRQSGITLLETLIAIAIAAVAGTGLTAMFMESTRTTQTGSDRMAAVQQVEDAGFMMSRDAQAAESIAVLTYPDLVEFSWTVWNLSNGTSVYYTATYSFVNMTNGVGTLRRSYWSSAGDNVQTTAGRAVYYNAADPSNTTFVTLADPVLTVQMTFKCNSAEETRMFQVVHRVNI